MRVGTFSFCAFVLACGGQVSNGNDAGSDGSSASDGGPGSADASILPQSSCVDGAWTGYIENFTFPSSSDAVTLSLTSNGASVTGTVKFGAGSPPATATDPNGVYPPGLQTQAMSAPSPATYVEGTLFTAIGGTFDGSRLQLGIATAEVFKTWCAIQPQTWLQQPNGPPLYECLPNWGFTCDPNTCSSTNPQNSSETITYPPEKLWLCQQVCRCDATTCAAPVSSADVKFDAVCTGTLDGSIAGALGTHNIHLKKQ